MSQGPQTYNKAQRKHRRAEWVAEKRQRNQERRQQKSDRTAALVRL